MEVLTNDERRRFDAIVHHERRRSDPYYRVGVHIGTAIGILLVIGSAVSMVVASCLVIIWAIAR